MRRMAPQLFAGVQGLGNMLEKVRSRRHCHQQLHGFPLPRQTGFGRRDGTTFSSTVFVAYLRAARSAHAAKANDTTRAVIRDIQASGIQTLTGIARTLQARGIKTPTGRHEWQPVQVSRLVAAQAGLGR
jgi:hypothetical protein